MTPADWAALANPIVAAVSVAGSIYWVTRRHREDETSKDNRRDAKDEALAEQIKTMTETARRGDETLADGLKTVNVRLGEAIGEFKKSNEAHAVHEKDCAEFRGATVAALNATAESLRTLAGAGERMAKIEQRMDTAEGKIDYGTRKFEGYDRQIANQMFSKGGAFVVEQQPEPTPTQSRSRARR